MSAAPSDLHRPGGAAVRAAAEAPGSNSDVWDGAGDIAEDVAEPPVMLPGAP